jgi:hypothetical protein
MAFGHPAIAWLAGKTRRSEDAPKVHGRPESRLPHEGASHVQTRFRYQLLETGLTLELTAKGTKYYTDDALN